MDRDRVRLAFFQLRYAMEKASVAVKAFGDAYWKAAEDELARLRASRRDAARLYEQERQVREAEYQAWKQQQEDQR